jgi:hypothetical protein
VRLEESLLQRAKEEAERRGRTVTALIEEGLLTVLSRHREKKRKRYRVPVMNVRGGLKPGLEWNSLEALANRLYDEEKWSSRRKCAGLCCSPGLSAAQACP